MKKFTFLLVLFAVVMVMGLIATPEPAEAVKWQQFTNYSYTGTWTNTHDTDPVYIGSEGTLYLYVKTIKRKSSTKAKIKTMDIWFDGTTVTFEKGKLYRKNGKNKLRAVYSDDYGTEGVIKATFKKKKKKLKGTYEHELGDEAWGGKINLNYSQSAG